MQAAVTNPCIGCANEPGQTMNTSTNLLLVDDHPHNLTALEAVLEPLGHKLVRATSGKEALKQLLIHDFAAILLDVQMPEMDGFETAALIRGRQRSRHIPILFLTALSHDKAHVDRGYGIGAVDYISKPFDPDLLRAKVAVFVELFQKNERLVRKSALLHAMRDREVADFKRDSERRYQKLAESMPQIVWTAAPDGKLTYANPRWFACAGLAEQAARALDWKDVLHPGDVAPLRLALQAAIADHGDWTSEYRFGNAPAGYRRHLMRVIADRDELGRVTSWIGTCTDIEDHKQAEDGLRLERTKLQDANRAKDEFLATVSHELRTPLHAMLGWTQILRSGRLEPSKVERALEVIERNAKAQAQLIADLLDVSRIVTGSIKVEFSELALAQVVEGAVEAAVPVAEAANVTLVVRLDSAVGRVRGDAIRLQQVVGNLLSNAIKFTPAGGRVEVELRREDQRALLRITDSGGGIEPAFLPHVFERFRQGAHGSASSRKGLGLGLAIVWHLVGLHDGVVSAASEGKDKGATFLVTLPLLAEPVAVPEPLTRADDQQAPVLESSALADLHVLLVEDDDDGRDLLRALLEDRGARVSTAHAAAPALDLLRTGKPDILVSDIGLPGEDGFALIGRVRALPPELGGMVPAIALTAYTSNADRNRALAAGFQAHLGKPLDPANLSATVLRLAGRGLA